MASSLTSAPDCFKMHIRDFCSSYVNFAAVNDFFFLSLQAAKPKAAEKDVKIEQVVNGKTKKPMRLFLFSSL